MERFVPEAALPQIRVPDARWRTVLHGMQPDILRRLREIAGSLAPWRIGYVGTSGTKGLRSVPEK